ncbi:hypothetical protein D7236_21660 [Stutzerimonas stutzeri]|nr:hypothetical protein [Stutzerimonas stutzeri]
MHASALSKHYLELARKPVNDSNFAGDDIRYSSEFELLEAELAKAGALYAIHEHHLLTAGCFV